MSARLRAHSNTAAPTKMEVGIQSTFDLEKLTIILPDWLLGFI
jgi:hypothetical protein